MTDLIMRVALYARVSSDRQAKDNTIASQVEALQSRIRHDGLQLDAEMSFLDDGYSGGSLVRPGLERLRDQAASGALDRLYIHSPDRLARNFAHQMLLVEEFQRCGVELVFLNQELATTPEGNLLLQVQGVMAEYERAKILERSRRGKLHAARAGRVSVLGHAPYGYRYVSKSQGDGEARYVIRLEEARVVRQIFEWVGIEGCSIREICKRLKESGVVPRHGKPTWSRATIAAMLKNPAYKGLAAYGKVRLREPLPQLRPRRGQPEFARPARGILRTKPEDQIPIAVPALVDGELFEAVGERLAGNRRHHGRPASEGGLLLRGLAVCQRCGYAFYGRRCGARRGERPKHLYYRCLGTDKGRFGGEAVCANRMVRAELLDDAVWADVRNLLMDPGRVQREYERRLSGRDDDRRSRASQSLGKLIADAKRKVSRLMEMYEDGYLEREAFKGRMDAARERLSRLEAESRAAKEEEQEADTLRMVIGQLEDFAQRVRSGLEECDRDVRQGIIRALVKRIEIGEDTIRIVYRVNPDPFAEGPRKGVAQFCPRSRHNTACRSARSAAFFVGSIPRTRRKVHRCSSPSSNLRHVAAAFALAHDAPRSNAWRTPKRIGRA